MSVKEDAGQNKERVLFSMGHGGFSAHPLDKPASAGRLAAVMQVSDLRERLNQFLHRQTVRKLTPGERAQARQWCLDLIHREHPDLTDEQAERFYENLIHVRVIAVDEWTRRLEGSF